MSYARVLFENVSLRKYLLKFLTYGAKVLNYKQLSQVVTFTTLVVVTFTTFDLIEQFTKRFTLGVGLTDEPFSILFAIDRGLNGQTSNTYLFADLTSQVMKLVDYDVSYFRAAGFFLLFLLAFYIWIMYLKISLRQDPLFKKLIYLFLILIISLLVASSFRFLLITPSYQWLIMCFSTLLPFFLIKTVRQSTKKIELIQLLAVALIIFIIEMSRPTSGFIAWLVSVIYIFQVKGFTKVFQFNLIFLAINLLYINQFQDAFFKSIIRYYHLSRFDSSASNLFNEIFDVSKAILMFYLTILLTLKISSQYLDRDKKIHESNIFHKFFSFAQFFTLFILFLNYSHKDMVHAYLWIFIFISSFIVFLRNRILNYKVLFLAGLPILTQFGSNISSTYLLTPFLLSTLLFLVLSMSSGVNLQKRKDLKTFENAEYFCLLCLALLLFVIQNISSSTGYENSFGQKDLKVDSASGLRYTSEKLNSIQNLRLQVGDLEVKFSRRVLDLSYWHPGVLFYLGDMQFPISTLDKSFSQTLEKQVEVTISQTKILGKFEPTALLLTTDSIVPSRTCKNISEYVHDQRIRFILKEQSFNPKVMEIGIYRSVVEDLTLYPSNVSYLIPCGQ